MPTPTYLPFAYNPTMRIGLPFLAAGLFCLACTQTMRDPSGPGGGSGGAGSQSGGKGGGAGSHEAVPPVGGGPGPIEGAVPSCVTGAGKLQKLSSLQLGNAVRDVLKASGADFALDAAEAALFALPPDVREGGFHEMDDRTSLNHIAAFYAVAAAVADAVVAQPDRVRAVVGACAAQGLSGACLDGFLSRFGRRVYRRPLTAADKAPLVELVTSGPTPAEGLRAALVQMLMAPDFLYHLEVGGRAFAKDPAVLRLTSFEVASRLSFLFWRSGPDDALLDAAERGDLDTEDGFRSQVERVFSDARTRETMWGFYRQWLRLEGFLGFLLRDRFLATFASGLGFEDPNKRHHDEMVAEIRALTDRVSWQVPGGIRELLMSTDAVSPSPFLAKLYGVGPFVGSGDPPQFPATQRAGLLTRAALLVSGDERTSPIHRGGFIRRSILCDEIPQPDPNALPPGSLVPPAPAAGSTTRQRFTAKTADPVCMTCHVMFNDIGYAMETYDGLGRYRTKETIYNEGNGRPTDELSIDTATVPRLRGRDDATKVSGAVELSKAIADSGKVEPCFARQVFRFSQRRAEDAEADACLVDSVTTVLTSKGGTLRDAFKQVALSPNFRVRRTSAP